MKYNYIILLVAEVVWLLKKSKHVGICEKVEK